MNKKIMLTISFLGVALVIVYFVFSDDAPNFTDIVQKEGPIIAFGDSLVEGVGASRDGGFVTILSERLGTSVINTGRAGDTTELALLRLEKDVLSEEPSAVIILLGGNDSLKKQPIENTFENLKLMIDMIHEAGGAVLLVGISPQIFGSDYTKPFEVLARDTKVSFVPDILDGLLGNNSLMSDPIHPNEMGYEIIADRIEPVLRKMLGL
jgi:acyl-CoA thioesterase I